MMHDSLRRVCERETGVNTQQVVARHTKCVQEAVLRHKRPHTMLHTLELIRPSLNLSGYLPKLIRPTLGLIRPKIGPEVSLSVPKVSLSGH